eukprot:scaffold322560_cov31-Tisochrysis_lutea.AAC.1
MTPARIMSSERTEERSISIGTRKARSMQRVMRGAMLRKTEMVPSVLCLIAYIDEISIALKRSGTVHPQRRASRLEPMWMLRHPTSVVPTVKTICISTSVTGNGRAVMASLLKMDMPAEEA